MLLLAAMVLKVIQVCILSHSSLYFGWSQNHRSCCFGCQSVRLLEFPKLGGHGRIATGELFDGDILSLVVGDAQVAVCTFECLFGLFQVIDGFVNFVDGVLTPTEN